MLALHTDLYQLTMAAGYWRSGKTQEIATFEMFVRRLPPGRDFLVVCGLEQALCYLAELQFDEEEIGYLRSLPQLAGVEEGFWEYLRSFRFTGDVWAVAEGTVLFPGEPLIVVRAPIAEAQIPETYLLSTLGFQTLIASKAARIVEAAAGRAVVEFGCRRAHSPEAGVLAGRAAYLAGCAGTSNLEAGFRFGVPVFGTAAHSWVLSFASEIDAFQALQELLGDRTVQLIDTYDTAGGARAAAALGKPLWGVRLDSGDLLALAKTVRTILDGSGLTDVKIMATNDLDEGTIQGLVEGGAPVDVFGVGTSLATSYDAPALGCVYKLVEHEGPAGLRYPAKKSAGKATLPGRKQIFRFALRDEVGRMDEDCPAGAVPLLRKVMDNGRATGELPSLEQSRAYAKQQITQYGKAARRVEYTEALMALED